MEQKNNFLESSVIAPEKFEINHNIHDSSLLISRLRHPVIRQQVISTLYNFRSKAQTSIRNDEWVSYLPEGWDGSERFKLMKGKKTGKVFDTEDLEKEFTKPLVTEKIIEEAYDNMVDHIEAVTEFDYASDSPDSEVMHLGWIQPWNEEVPSVKQWSAIEAHEKGHKVRTYHELDAVFKEGFEVSKATFTEDDYQALMRDGNRRTLKTEKVGPVSLKEEQEIFFEYLFSAIEIAERMSQLKNYFGFSGAEEFTKAHLDYARAHYLKDTDMQNGMRQFFEAITSETEEKFLSIINNYGI